MNKDDKKQLPICSASTHHSPKHRQQAASTQQFPPLALEVRPAVDTATAAHWLLRQQQTLRGWACHEDGPIRPLRIHGRLAWPVSEIKRVLGVPE